MELAHLADLAGTDNPGGIGTEIFIAPLADFLALKALKTTTLAGDAVTIDGTHTFKDVSPDPALGFYKMYATLGTGEAKFDESGDPDGETYKVMLTGIHPGNKKDAAEVFRKAKNTQVIAIFKNPDGVMEQIGNAIWPAKMKASYGTSKPGTGVKGYTFEISAFQMSKQFYEGTITLHD